MKFWTLITFLFALTALKAADIPFEAKEGQSITMTASADGNPVPKYDWFKNSVKIATDIAVLNLPGVLTDAGSYYVRAYNSAGEATSDTVILTIAPLTEMPAIATQPVNQTIKEGLPATFSVVATGKPAPTYQWRKNGLAIAGATNATYTIPVTTRTDSGDYTVVVTNSVGSVTSAIAKLDVQYAPVFNKPSIIIAVKTVNVPQKGTAVFSVVAEGENLRYQWYRGSMPLNGETKADLILSRVNPSFEGNYTVYVSNEYGQVSSSARLNVIR